MLRTKPSIHYRPFVLAEAKRVAKQFGLTLYLLPIDGRLWTYTVGWERTEEPTTVVGPDGRAYVYRHWLKRHKSVTPLHINDTRKPSS